MGDLVIAQCIAITSWKFQTAVGHGNGMQTFSFFNAQLFDSLSCCLVVTVTHWYLMNTHCFHVPLKVSPHVQAPKHKRLPRSLTSFRQIACAWQMRRPRRLYESYFYQYKANIARLHCRELERNNICTAAYVSLNT